MNRDSAQSFYLGSEDIEEAWEERLLAHIEFFRTKVAVLIGYSRIYLSQLDIYVTF